MNMLIIVEIVAAILVLAAAVRFAVRDTRRRSGASLQPSSGPEDTPEVPEHEAEQHRSEVADQRDGEEAAALSVSSTSLEPPADNP
ncbi:MAG: hypothetical protein ACRDRO_06140 [Pseudonocardiaceae bacterium]